MGSSLQPLSFGTEADDRAGLAELAIAFSPECVRSFFDLGNREAFCTRGDSASASLVVEAAFTRSRLYG